ncbi:anthrone oxygenase family protein [Streptomyces sp. NPDC059999]|uniref:anthrone oxygenase family protein n=1 Tax=Streptomyces sp. NPDC059999 TaxID=3347030 RepID=UPI00368F2DCC
MRIRLVHALALLATGLLAGAFGYGAANLVPTFNAVPLDMRLSFHAELMRMNGITMQSAMAVSTLSSLTLAALTRGRARLISGTAGLLAIASFLVTRLGNVPINGRIKQWALTSAPADHAEVLRRWELFNNVRTLTALAAFGLLIVLAVGGRPAATRPTHHQVDKSKDDAPSVGANTAWIGRRSVTWTWTWPRAEAKRRTRANATGTATRPRSRR